jgi:PadR family transcriptional regulator
MSHDRELRKGSAEVLILSLLDERDRHGYELAKLIERRSDGALKFHVASLYPTLYRLERRRSWSAFFSALNRVARIRPA